MVLALENVTKLYKNGRGVQDISFTLAPGEVLGLLGPNGSGKTTTMKAIAGLLRINRGAIRICGVDALAQHEEAMQSTGCLIESPPLYEHMSAEENLRLAARFYRNVGAERITEVLQMLGMEPYRKERVRTFSLGMRQRVGLAAALISQPRLLILDEPANGLDIEGMVYVREVVKAAAEKGAAVLISSHLAHEIEQCATKAAIMHSGKLLAVSDMADVLAAHASLEDYFLAQVGLPRLNEDTRFRR